MEEAKDIHTSLRKASGIMKFVQDTLLPQVMYIIFQVHLNLFPYPIFILKF